MEWNETEKALLHQILAGDKSLIPILADATEESGHPLGPLFREVQKNPKNQELADRIASHWGSLQWQGEHEARALDHWLPGITKEGATYVNAVVMKRRPLTLFHLRFFPSPGDKTLHVLVPHDTAQSVLSSLAPDLAKVHAERVAYTKKRYQ